MSAVTWEEAGLAGVDTPIGRMPRRHLSLVPAGDAVAESAKGGVQLTRRGRLAITLLIAGLVLVAAFVGIRQATATPSYAIVGSGVSVTVAAGETMSQIAARELPSLPIREGVARIQILNNLSTTAISAGQTLAIPAG